MKTIQNQTFDEERALYGSRDILVKDCAFDGPADGESAFKECADIRAEHCFFRRRKIRYVICGIRSGMCTG